MALAVALSPLRGDVLEAARGLLEDENPEARLAAIVAIELLAGPRETGDLPPLLEDPDEKVKHAAHRALERLTAHRLGPDRAAWEKYLARPYGF